MKLSDFIVKDAIVPELKATDRDGVIRELVTALADAKALPANEVDAIVKAIVTREKNGSTGFGKGVAVPHVKHASVKKSVGAIGRSAAGVDFAALDQAPVYSIFLLLSPVNNPDGHLQAMENIFRNLQQDNFRRFLRQSDTKQKIVDLLEEADQASATH
jgi:mannitol/fructose-specific phosphotransferase system IIA component (Ntr-type)